MLVAKITSEKADTLKGKEYVPGGMFGPILDKNDNWIISLVEAQFLELGDFVVIEFEAPIIIDKEE